ncbi:hypothetical protein J6590_016675 [Homalodisca vitripennis]|nr:hypothetical protein J6590_016675 [Homalodisca vitripennis]
MVDAAYYYSCCSKVGTYDTCISEDVSRRSFRRQVTCYPPPPSFSLDSSGSHCDVAQAVHN